MLLLALPIPFLLGLALLMLGLRGRRIDDHPICRRCRFDLVGIYPGVNQCPECGSPLTSMRRLRHGRRRRVRSAVAVGVVLLGTSLGVAGFFGVGAVREVQWAQLKPEWLLEMGLDSRDAMTVAAAFTELARRMEGETLDEARAARLIARVLAEHADPQASWTGERQLFIAAAWGQRMTRQQKQQFARNGITFRVEAPDVIREGDPIPFRIVPVLLRTVPSFNLVGRVDPTSIEAGGDPVAFALPRRSIEDRFPDFNWSFASSLGRSANVELSPGQHPLNVEWSVSVSQWMADADFIILANPPTRTATFNVTFKVRSQHDTVVSPRHGSRVVGGNDPELLGRITQRLSLSCLSLDRSTLHPTLYTHLSFADDWNWNPHAQPDHIVPRQIDFEVIAVAGDERWMIDRITLHRHANSAIIVFTELEGLSSDRIRIILVPLDEAMQERLGEIVIEELLLGDPPGETGP